MKEASASEQQTDEHQTDEQQASLLALSRRSRRAAERETAAEREAPGTDHFEQGTDGSGPGGAQEDAGFRHWCRQRPFISGLLVVLGGIELFFSSQLDTGNLQIQFGIEGLQATVIPIVLVLLGASAIFRPTHHVFYGIIALVLGVYSLIGVNLGGFIFGMLLSSIGAVLVVAWMGPRGPRAKKAKKSKKSHAKELGAEASAAERKGNQESVSEERDS
ncbi:DUF6114 domain-containing protein [Brevibacterium antiquum]|uniref:DUF4064 domain-containing protein n=1 Tax=Brevibacterium antiquum TaxID=234835 RepID=A0A2H1J129_9MICO|nr:DUF6114 domain-containing protein [Brevibacterium antiquum]SMX80912.1 hypothetical protein BANT10_01477 [Brevibacterium antiquum]